MKIGYQGSPGSYSHEALRQYFGANHQAQGFETSEQVFEALENNQINYAILPIENSIVGNVTLNQDLFYQSSATVVAEHILRIEHCLLANPGTKLEDLSKVASHPIALAQCRDFLDRHKLRAAPDFDTAGAAARVAEEKNAGEGAIASKICAELYGLSILSQEIQKVQNNYTRFWVGIKGKISHPINGADKISVALALKHHPGALLEVLKIFADSEINLTRLESRPDPHNPFRYIFYVDFEGEEMNPKIQHLLKVLEERTLVFKVLGSYKMATTT